MTIENVLERTIVRAVHPNSEAFRLNVRPNSIILNIGSARLVTFLSFIQPFTSPSTLYQTHLETLESLKNTVRPVKLRLCKIDENVGSAAADFSSTLILCRFSPLSEQRCTLLSQEVKVRYAWLVSVCLSFHL
jgi:hypothetical protein